MTTPKPDAFEEALDKRTLDKDGFMVESNSYRDGARWSRSWTRANDPDVRALVEALEYYERVQPGIDDGDTARDALKAWKEKGK